jgi:hypothetical protein
MRDSSDSRLKTGIPDMKACVLLSFFLGVAGAYTIGVGAFGYGPLGGFITLAAIFLVGAGHEKSYRAAFG